MSTRAQRRAAARVEASDADRARRDADSLRLEVAGILANPSRDGLLDDIAKVTAAALRRAYALGRYWERNRIQGAARREVTRQINLRRSGFPRAY